MAVTGFPLSELQARPSPEYAFMAIVLLFCFRSWWLVRWFGSFSRSSLDQFRRIHPADDSAVVNPGETTMMPILRCALSGEAHSSIRFSPKSEFTFSLLSQFRSGFGRRTSDLRSVSP
ncbi:hypothetical protein LINPERPRIM_LOCUS18339 [Linum perenne]